MKTKTYAKIAVCIGVLGIAAGTIFIRYSQSSALSILFYRLLFTSLLLMIPLLVNKRTELITTFKSEYRSYKGFLWVAFFNTFAMVSWVYAVKNTSVASATMISNAHPILVLLVSMFVLKIKYNKKAIVGALVTLIGCAAMSARDYMAGGGHITGDIFAFAAGMSFGLYLLTAKSVREKFSLDVFMFINFALSFFYIAFVSVLLKESLVPMPINELLIFLCLALFTSLIGHGGVDWGLRYVSSAFASLAFLMENIYAIILGMIFVSEFPPLSQLVCGAVLIMGVLVFNRYENA